MPLHSEKHQRPGVAQYGTHMVVSEGLACQNLFLSIFLFSFLFFRSPAPRFFFLPKWEGAAGSGYLGRSASREIVGGCTKVIYKAFEKTIPGKDFSDGQAVETR
jgi:hypothetical protein